MSRSDWEGSFFFIVELREEVEPVDEETRGVEFEWRDESTEREREEPISSRAFLDEQIDRVTTKPCRTFGKGKGEGDIRLTIHQFRRTTLDREDRNEDRRRVVLPSDDDLDRFGCLLLFVVLQWRKRIEMERRWWPTSFRCSNNFFDNLRRFRFSTRRRRRVLIDRRVDRHGQLGHLRIDFRRNSFEVIGIEEPFVLFSIRQGRFEVCPSVCLFVTYVENERFNDTNLFRIVDEIQL